jgi:murein endopeptidase
VSRALLVVLLLAGCVEPVQADVAARDETKPAEVAVVDPEPTPELVGDPEAREREIMDLSRAEIADDVLLQLPGSAGLGIVDVPATSSVPDGGTSIGTPQRGWLHQGVALPLQPALYTRRDPDRSWGSTHTVRTIITALGAMRTDRNFHGEVIIGDISRPRGGPFPPHVSHQSGRDIDIRLVLAPGLPARTYPSTPAHVDWDATWGLLHSFLETGHVSAVFFDYRQQEHLHAAAVRAGVHARVSQRWFQWPGDDAEALIRHEDGHRAHLHIRLGCGPAEPHCKP